MDIPKKVYIGVHKETGQAWCGRKIVYEAIGGLKAAMKTSWRGRLGSSKDCIQGEYDIYSYELKEGKLE